MITSNAISNESIPFFQKHVDALFRFVQDFTADTICAHQILEQVLSEWLKSPVDPDKCSFAELMRMTRNRALIILTGQPEIPDPEKRFFRFSDKIGEREKSFFYHSYFRGISPETIATSFNTSVEQVKNGIRRSLLDINDQLTNKTGLS